MINIRPISDLRNKYNEIEDAVLKSKQYWKEVLILQVLKYIIV